MVNDSLSTTRLLTIAHERSGGNISEAIRTLDGMRFHHKNAKSAVRVLRETLQKQPQATSFSLNRAFVVVS